MIRLGKQQHPKNDRKSNTQIKLYAFNELNVLDTKTWMWLSPSIVRGDIAHPRYDASGGLLYGKYWMILGGTNLNRRLTCDNLINPYYTGMSEFAWTNDVNVLEIPNIKSSNSNSVEASGTFTWVYNITDPTLGIIKEGGAKELGGGAIAGIVLGSLAAAVLLIALVWVLLRKKHDPLGPVTAVRNAMISMIWDRR